MDKDHAWKNIRWWMVDTDAARLVLIAGQRDRHPMDELAAAIRSHHAEWQEQEKRRMTHGGVPPDEQRCMICGGEHG